MLIYITVHALVIPQTRCGGVVLVYRAWPILLYITVHALVRPDVRVWSKGVALVYRIGRSLANADLYNSACTRRTTDQM